jgi:hypothetical protein
MLNERLTGMTPFSHIDQPGLSLRIIKPQGQNQHISLPVCPIILNVTC